MEKNEDKLMKMAMTIKTRLDLQEKCVKLCRIMMLMLRMGKIRTIIYEEGN